MRNMILVDKKDCVLTRAQRDNFFCCSFIYLSKVKVNFYFFFFLIKWVNGVKELPADCKQSEVKVRHDREALGGDSY